MSKHRIHCGGWGRMNRCGECGAMPFNFGDIMFAHDGICPTCGSEHILRVIARPRWIEHWWRGRGYIKPEVKSAEQQL